MQVLEEGVQSNHVSHNFRFPGSGSPCSHNYIPEIAVLKPSPVRTEGWQVSSCYCMQIGKEISQLSSHSAIDIHIY